LHCHFLYWFPWLTAATADGHCWSTKSTLSKKAEPKTFSIAHDFPQSFPPDPLFFPGCWPPQWQKLLLSGQ
jgi:hypothetical protein